MDPRRMPPPRPMRRAALEVIELEFEFVVVGVPEAASVVWIERRAVSALSAWFVSMFPACA